MINKHKKKLIAKKINLLKNSILTSSGAIKCSSTGPPKQIIAHVRWVIISVCLFVCMIIAPELLEQFVSNLDLAMVYTQYVQDIAIRKFGFVTKIQFVNLWKRRSIEAP